jgi:hypothetical protein
MRASFDSEFDEVVNTAVQTVAGLPDAEFADRLLALAKGLESVIRTCAPRLSESEVTIVRQHFIATVVARCNLFGDNTGSTVGMPTVEDGADTPNFRIGKCLTAAPGAH